LNDNCFCRCDQLSNSKKALHFFAETMAQKFRIMQTRGEKTSSVRCFFAIQSGVPAEHDVSIRCPHGAIHYACVTLIA
jgi:hypothetical protein